MKKIMKTKLQFILASLLFVSLCTSSAIAEESSAEVVSGNNKPTELQAIDKAHKAADAESSHVEKMEEQASAITDDEGMRDEDMEMPEEDLESAPAGSLAE